MKFRCLVALRYCLVPAMGFLAVYESARAADPSVLTLIVDDSFSEDSILSNDKLMALYDSLEPEEQERVSEMALDKILMQGRYAGKRWWESQEKKKDLELNDSEFFIFSRPSARVVQKLIDEGLTHGELSVRLAAIRAMGRTQHPSALPLIESCRGKDGRRSRRVREF